MDVSDDEDDYALLEAQRALQAARQKQVEAAERARLLTDQAKELGNAAERLGQGEALLRMLAGRRASSANAARSEQAARAFKAALGADGLPPACRAEVEARAEMARQAAIAANPACAQS